MRPNAGFTLLEIIIAIAIIAIFLILPILAYSSYLKKARDEKRKSDLTKISQSVENYKAEKGTYPPSLPALVSNGFLPEIPKDPLDNQNVSWSTTNEKYHYEFDSPNGTSYTLTAPLETGAAAGGGSEAGSYFIITPNSSAGNVASVPELTQAAANTPTVIFTEEPYQSPTALPSISNTPSATPTASNTPLPTSTPTPSNTPIISNTPTITPTPSRTPTPSNTPTRTPTPTPTRTPTPTPPSYKIAYYKFTSPVQLWTMYGDGQTKALAKTLGATESVQTLKFGADTNNLLVDLYLGSGSNYTLRSIRPSDGLSYNAIVHNGVALSSPVWSIGNVIVAGIPSGTKTSPEYTTPVTTYNSTFSMSTASYRYSDYKVVWAAISSGVGESLHYSGDWRTSADTIKLSVNNSTMLSPQLDPTGTKIVYGYLPPGWTNQNQEEIYLYNLTAGTNTRLTNNAVMDDMPAWTRTGSQIIWVKSNTSQAYSQEIWIMNADGTSQTGLTSNSANTVYCTLSYNSQDYAVSPNNAKIVYYCQSSTGGGPDGIYTMNVNGTSKTLLEASGYAPVFSR